MVLQVRSPARAVVVILSWLIAACVIATVAGCGGDGGSDSAPPAPATPVPVANAGPGQTVPQGATLTFDGTASSDPGGRTLAYAWSLSSRPAGSAAVLSDSGMAHPTITTDVAGTYVATLTVGNGVASSSPASATLVATPFTPLAIRASQLEPVSVTLNLALTGDPGAGVPITYRVDGVALASPQNGYANWDTTSGPDGPHVVTAHLQFAANVFIDVVRTFQVRQTPITTSPFNVYSGGATIGASSPYGIASVAYSVDGGPTSTLTAPNVCITRLLCAQFPNVRDAYQFVTSPPPASGVHSIVVVITDLRGYTYSPVVAVATSNAPMLSLASPADGAIVAGSVRLAGMATSDRPGVVAVVARLVGGPLLQGYPIVAQSTGPSFDLVASLGGYPAGLYTLQVGATDAANLTTYTLRQLVLASSSALAYTPLLTVGSAGTIVSADGDRLLYASNGYRLRDTSTNQEAVLTNIPTYYRFPDYVVDAGYVYASGARSDCSTVRCVYRWDATGTSVNLSSAAPFNGSTSQLFPVARTRYVTWLNEPPDSGLPSSFTLHGVDARSFTQIVMPADALALEETPNDIGVANGTATVVFSARTGAVNVDVSPRVYPTYDVYSWDNTTRISNRRSNAGFYSHGPKTDGVRMAWSQTALGPDNGVMSNGVASLVVADLPSGSATVVSTSMVRFALSDGVLAWSERSPAPSADVVKASTGNGTVVVSATSLSTLYGTDAGRVVYGERGQLYSWDSATGVSTLLFDTLPTSLLQSGRILYFTYGPDQDVYKVMLR